MSAVYVKHPLTAGRTVNGLAFVVTAEDNKLHTLNPTASHLWSLCSGGVTVEAAAASLCEAFDVELETALADAAECLADLARRDIVAVRKEPAAPAPPPKPK